MSFLLGRVLHINLRLLFAATVESWLPCQAFMMQHWRKLLSQQGHRKQTSMQHADRMTSTLQYHPIGCEVKHFFSPQWLLTNSWFRCASSFGSAKGSVTQLSWTIGKLDLSCALFRLANAILQAARENASKTWRPTGAKNCMSICI